MHSHPAATLDLRHRQKLIAAALINLKIFAFPWKTFTSEGCTIRDVSFAICLACPDSDCPFKARPPSRGAATKTCENVAHHGGHPPQLVLQPCTAKFSYATNLATGTVTLTATCHLPYDRPPPKGPCPATMAAIQKHMQESGKKYSNAQELCCCITGCRGTGCQSPPTLYQ
jgi:hypothetical protein